MLVVAPTVIAEATRAGDELHALALELPAASAYVMPELIELATALSSVVLAPPPRLMLATAGFTAFEVTQLTPLITPAVVPLPEQLSTLTATRRTPLATPYLVPPTVPATCVPWPLQSVLLVSTVLVPQVARPPKSLCVVRMPVSMM